MYKILCFGDSNVWGFVPNSGKRYDGITRWTKVLEKLLGDNFQIIEAGCNNRTAFCKNENSIEQDGLKILPKYLDTSFDIIILSIGINDLQIFYNTSENKFETGLNLLIKETKKYKKENAKIILAVPIKLNEKILEGFFSTMFDKNSIKKSFNLPLIYKNIAHQNEILYLDLNETENISLPDGLHYSKETHKKIAEKIHDFIIKNFIKF